MYGRCHILGISSWPAAGSGPHLSPARIPEGKLFRDLGPPIPLDPDYQFLRSPLRPTPPSCVTCLLGPFARGPDVQGLDFPGPPCCPARCVPGSRLHVVPLPGVVSHGPAVRPTGLLPVPLRHDRLRSTGENNFLSIGVSPVTLACFPVGSTRVVSGRFLSHSFGPAPLARSPACHLALFPAHSFWLLPAPVHPRRSCGISRPGRESTQLSSCWLLRGVWRPPCTQPLQCPGEHK